MTSKEIAYENGQSVQQMTKRECFAMAAMQGVSSIPECEDHEFIAKWCVAMADALLLELQENA